ncbi:MAG: PadR family transcriptional regulator [Acidobacteriaceae bacterium]|nr:PadR family transcriptional regulator [Acidobacteriaceae bacterium]MBV9501085.1 PadR family transcriptional regulator [Acidobacteriaceae bacterium]
MAEFLRDEIPPGTLHLLILKILARGPNHGYGIAQFVESSSRDVLRVEEGSLYPALQRMLLKGWVRAEWRDTENKRRARFYSLTALGRKQLELEISRYRRVSQAIVRVIEASS